MRMSKFSLLHKKQNKIYWNKLTAIFTEAQLLQMSKCKEKVYIQTKHRSNTSTGMTHRQLIWNIFRPKTSQKIKKNFIQIYRKNFPIFNWKNDQSQLKALKNAQNRCFSDF